MKQAEVHGMSATGGDVQSNLRLSDEPIASDLIPKGHADLIISLEPMESLRYLPYLKKEGWLVTNSRPFVNIPNYPEIEKVNAELDRAPSQGRIGRGGDRQGSGFCPCRQYRDVGCSCPIYRDRV